MDIKATKNEAISAWYLIVNLNYRKPEVNYVINYRLIRSWVMNYKGVKRNHNPKPKEQKVWDLSFFYKSAHLQGNNCVK